MCRITDPMDYVRVLWTCIVTVPFVLCYNIDIDRPLIFSGPLDSYFGYSVALINNSQGSWVLSGAPKGQSRSLPNVDYPGTLYKCPLHKAKGRCSEILLDTRGNGWGSTDKTRFKARKDFHWLGVSVDVEPLKSNITVCAHKWADAKFRNYHYLVNGMCFELNGEFHRKSAQKLHPLVENGNQVDSTGLFIYGSGMAGFSAHYALDGSLLLGAPGLKDWRGGLIRYYKKNKTIAEEFNSPDGYAGYSISSGRLFGDKLIYYVTGAPKDSHTGQVYILNAKMQITSKLIGKQMSENFGAAVLAIDLNGDGLDDLMVGAPTYSYAENEGRVYVFINKDLGIFYLSRPVLDGTKSPGAQFGSAISSLRDVNLDGFPDVVIGAPFEDGGIGAIYIYNGYENGLRDQYSQRIQGRELQSDLRSFGFSFSRVHDIDGNSYGDFAVGSILTDKVVVLLGRPVINVDVEMKFSVSTIDLKTKNCAIGGDPVTCFTVTVCFHFNDAAFSDDIDLDYTLTADTMEKYVADTSRIFFRQNGQVNSVKSKTRVTKNKYSCQQHQALAFDSQDIITPVEFAVSYQLSPFNKTKESSSVSVPVLNIYKSTNVSKQVSFYKHCGSDNICDSELELETELVLPQNRDYLISGEDSYISHKITVTNLGELAYLTTVTIAYPSSLQYVRVSSVRGPRPTVCTPSVQENGTLEYENETTVEERTLVVCDIGNPVRSMETVLFEVKMFVDSRNPDRDPLQIKTEVHTKSSEKNDSLSDNAAIDYLLIRLKASLIVTGISSPEQMRLLRTDLKRQDTGILHHPFNHVYEIGNLGPSRLPMGQIYITVLLDNDVSDMVRVERMEVIDPGTGLVLKNLCKIIRPSNISTTDSAGHKDTQYKYNGQVIDYSQISEVVDPRCQDFSCTTGGCTIENLEPETSVQVRCVINVQSNVFVEIQDKNLIKINSSAKFVEYLDPMYIGASSADQYNTTVCTDLYTDVRRGGVSVWALIASFSAGLAALIVFVILLWRVGFFRRKKREDLTRLIEERESESGGRQNTVANDNLGIALQPLRRRHDPRCSDPDHYEEPVLHRHSDIANGHGSRLLHS